MDLTLLIIGSVLLVGWGIAHLFPTGNVVKGFGEISEDNRNIIRMEWINEGAILIFLGALVAIIGLTDPTAMAARAVYWAVFAFLNVLSLISIFTGFRVNFLPFKLCPIIFTSSSILVLLGGIILP
jgi:hypothetical protein